MVAVWPPRAVVMSRAARSFPGGALGRAGGVFCESATQAKNKEKNIEVAARE
jgi:hypothetical protein